MLVLAWLMLGATEAVIAEEKAFVAVEEERWCDAVHLFVEADRLEPSDALLLNAAHAAELGGDRARALELTKQVVAKPNGAKNAAVQQQLKKLTQRVAKEGPGTPCPAPATTEPKQEPAPDPQPGPVPDPAPRPAEAAPDLTPVLWGTAGLGGVALVGGTVLAAVGSLPFFEHGDARARILEAELAGADAAALQDQQAAARSAWEGWGQATVIAGVLVSTVGALVTAGGVAGALLLPLEESP
jgi:hypothetical protein